MNFKKIIQNLTDSDLKQLKKIFNKYKNQLPTYTYAKITDKNLKQLFNIERKLGNTIFTTWFNTSITLKAQEIKFLTQLLNKEIDYIRIYKEEDLKVHFIAPILNHINFKLLKHNIRDFYEEPLTYQTDKFILNGLTDFIVAKGLEYAEKPYFFIQEFKRSEEYSNPRPQLIAELISAIELNNQTTLKVGCSLCAVLHNTFSYSFFVVF